jgi:hypothetical protein
MRTFVKLASVALLVATTGFSPSAPTAAAMQDVTMLQSIGPLTFGPNDVLFAADTQGASIFALELGAAAKVALREQKTLRRSIRRSRRSSAPTRPRSR